MTIKTFILTCGLAVCLLAQPGVAGQLEDGWAAYGHSDYATALKLWRQLAEQGNAAAQGNLGSMYHGGYGVSQDYVEALKWYRKAADQGDAHAQNFLGGMYDKGQGVPQDYVQAHMWFNLASAGYRLSDTMSRDGAITYRDLVAGKMTPDQIAEAQRLAREWLAAHPKK
jgi:TPR repeat protein